MTTIDEFWPTYIEEFKGRMEEKTKEIDELSDDHIIMLALELIMEEQQRTGHRSQGWPSDDHQATRFVLHNRTRSHI